jgi:DNA-binding GntR family transcriptional regulator
MSTNLKQRIRRVVAEQATEAGADTVSEETLKTVLSGNAGVEPHEVERALDELVADGTLVEDGGRYGLAEDEM